MNPIVKKTVNNMVNRFRISEVLALRIYSLVDWIYGTEWDKVRIRKREPILDKPKTLSIGIEYNSANQELSQILRLNKIEFRDLARMI